MTYARLLHDVQREDLNFKPRSKQPGWNGKPNPPETVVFADKPGGKIGKGYKIPYRVFDSLLLKINGQRAYKAITIPAAGWINNPPNAESLSFGGNLIEIDAQDGDWYRVKAMSFEHVPSTPVPLNYFNYPEFVHKFCAVRKNGGFLKLGFGMDAYIPFLKREALWIHKSQIELFPVLIDGGLPVTVTARGSLFASGDLHVRLHPNPSGYVLGALNHGYIVRIHSYHCSGGDVWGQINWGNGLAYICLQRQSGWRVEFFTTWTMNTVPPL